MNNTCVCRGADIPEGRQVAPSFESSGAVIVSWDFSKKDTNILIVGRQTYGKVDIINAFQDEEAVELMRKLTGYRCCGGDRGTVE